MIMKIASMNIQNLFHRDLSFRKEVHSKNLQRWMGEFQHLMDLPKKDDQALDRLRELSFTLGFGPHGKGPSMVLRRIGGRHYLKAVANSSGPRASAQLDWNGWAELRSFPLEERIQKAKLDCIRRTAPDILVLQEVEDRQSLADFNRECLAPLLDGTYDQWLFVEGNDPRGLGHGILVRNGYTLEGMRTHAHDRDGAGGDLFAMESPEFMVLSPKGERITLISTRFQEDTPDDQRVKRKAQALKLRRAWEGLQAHGKNKLLICGTFGEVAYGKGLAPLLGRRDLKDIAQHPYFDSGEIQSVPGTLATSRGKWIAKHDYLLLSPELYGRIQGCGVERPRVKPGPGTKGAKPVHGEVSDTRSFPMPPLLWVDIEDV